MTRRAGQRLRQSPPRHRSRSAIPFRPVAVSLVTGLATLSVTAFAGPVAGATTDLVTNCSGSVSDPGSLPYEVANASSGDVITFAVACPATTGQPLIALSTTIAVATNLTIDGPGANALAVGDTGGGVFSVAGGVTATISGFTIRGNAPAGTVGGGGIVNDGTLTLTDSILPDDNSGFDGGGIYNAGALDVADSTLAGDRAKVDGGGIYNDGGTVVVSHSTLLANSASAHGGAVYNAGATTNTPGGTVTITDSTVANNSATDDGGAVYNDVGAEVSVTGSTISGGGGGLDGGGIDNLGSATVTDSTLSGNIAYMDGGGVYNTGTLGISTSTLAGNVTGNGAALYNGGGTATVTSSTLADNDAGDGIGGGIDNASGAVTVSASIVADSTVSGAGSRAAADCSGVVTDLLYNLDDDGTCGFNALTDHSHTPAGLDPSGLGDHGGPTDTVALLPGSDAIGAVPGASRCSAPDQRGLARPTPCDIGAYETNPEGLGQTITFTTTAPSSESVRGPLYSVSASASSGLPVVLSIDPTSASVCYFAQPSVVFTGTGTCAIDANQGGNLSYNPAPQVQQSISVGRASQTLTFTSTSPSNATVGGPSYSVTAITTGVSGNPPIVISIDSSAASVCAIPTTETNGGATVAFVGAGTCVIDANEAGNADYDAAPQVQQSFSVAPTPQAITFTSSPPPHAIVGGPTYAVSAVGGASGVPVLLSIDRASTMVCSIAGGSVAFIGAGTCTVDANQAGNADYGAAPQAQQTFSVMNRGSPVFVGPASKKVVADRAFTLRVRTHGVPAPTITVAAGSTLPTGVTLADHTDGGATLAGSLPTGTFSFSLTASNARGSVTQSFTLTAVPPRQHAR